MTDEELIKRLRAYAQIEHAAAPWGFAGEGEVLSISADRIEALVKANRELVLQGLADSGQAQEAYEALVKERDRYRDAFNTNCLVLRATKERVERMEARLGEYNLLWQAYDGDLYQAYVDANEARIDAEAKLAKAVGAKEKARAARFEAALRLIADDAGAGTWQGNHARAALEGADHD